jgi:hypothetical protein
VAYTPVLDATLNNCVDVDDDKYDAGDLQNVCESTAEPHTYEVTITADGCEQEVITNTATVIGDDGEELDSDDATVTVEKVCVTVQKRANSSFDRDCTWRLDKAVVGEDEQIVAAGESATFSYEVTLAGSCEDSNFVVSGGIRITNDGTADVTINSVADVLDDGTVASVDCGAAVFPVTLEPGEVLGCSYTASPDDMSSTLNTATASTSSDAGNQDFSGTAAVSWGAPTNTTDECVTVVDDQYGPLGEFCVDRRAGTFGPEVIAEYDLTVGPVANCDTEELVNTATATANDTGTRVSDSETVSASVPCFGCTPGGFKNSPARWEGTGYTQGQTVGSVFTGSNYYSSTTLLAALDLPGGSGLKGAEGILLRSAVAALLNAAHPDINYPLTTPEVINQVNAALATDNRGATLALATTLDGYNNLGCPIDAHGNPIEQ